RPAPTHLIFGFRTDGFRCGAEIADRVDAVPGCGRHSSSAHRRAQSEADHSTENRMTESLIQLPTAGEPVIDTFDRMIRTGPIVPYELPGGVRAWMAVSHQAVSEVLAGDGTLFSKNTRNCPAMHDGTIPADWPL